MKIKLPKKLQKTVDRFTPVFTRISNDRITVYAAQASFFVIISAIPFVMLLILMLQTFMPVDKNQMMQIMYQYLPPSLIDFATQIMDEIFSRAHFSVLSVAAVAILWTSSRGLSGISQGIKNVYRCPPGKIFVLDYLFSLLYTLVFIGIMSASVIILVFGGYIQNILRQHSAALAGIVDKLMFLRGAIFLVFLTLIFMLAYKVLGKSEMKFKRQFPGALFAAVGWIVFSFGYSIYINNFSNYSYVYGSLAAIMLLMLWLYMCMIILLLGAELNIMLYEKKTYINT
ncbi:MAG: YihY/virulence factor BrkB family protein [Clostridia bacterium]|nr:YihY/virulence factor BrkB family protein [Clostridia bacterium]